MPGKTSTGTPRPPRPGATPAVYLLLSGLMEQVENQPDEPKAGSRRKATPPVALFLPPAIPPQAAPQDKPDEAPVKARKAAAKRNPDFTPPATLPTPTASHAEPLPIDVPEPRSAPPRKSTAKTAEAATPKKTSAKTATRSTPKARTTRPEPVEPTPLVQAEPSQAENDHGGTRTPVIEVTSADLWAAVKAEPRRAPAAVALAAVQQLGRSAEHQANWLRSTYPNIEPERLAKIAYRNATSRIRFATIASVPFAGVAGLPVYAWTQARLILELAAIFGHDATHPRRAAEILVLLGQYQDLYDADAAIDAVVDTARDVPLVPRFGVGIAPHVIRRFAGKILPGAGLLIDGLASAHATDDLAVRATRFYRDRALVAALAVGVLRADPWPDRLVRMTAWSAAAAAHPVAGEVDASLVERLAAGLRVEAARSS